MKPMLACDWDEAKLRFPLIALPKIDGVRGLSPAGKLVARSLEPHANVFVTKMLSKKVFLGVDGELAAGEPSSPSLCRDTTSLMNTFDRRPDSTFRWHAFDNCDPRHAHRPFAERYALLARRAEELTAAGPVLIVPAFPVGNLGQLLRLKQEWLRKGYEGVILRDPNAPYKHGRSTAAEGGFLRIKDFSDEEGVVVSIEEGRSNQNPKKTNALGLTERSTHAENMRPNGLLGSMQVRRKDGSLCTVSPGKMTADDKRRYLRFPDLLIGHTIKFKFFAHGVKDKPRFPTYISHRSKEDQS